jgi:tellurite resistance protein TehA-like permease
MDGMLRRADTAWFATRPGRSVHELLRHVGPVWFATAMGTGMVSNAAMLLPAELPGQHAAALVVWLLAVALVVVLSAATVLRWARHPEALRRDLRDPATAPFHGAPPMALLTVGAGALLAGRDLLGEPAALWVAGTLWVTGTLLGVMVTAAVPALLARGRTLRLQAAAPTLLLAVVPPMVSASTGAGLAASLPVGRLRDALLVACCMLLAISLLAALPTIGMVWARLAAHGSGPAQAVPTLFIVLGPLGQSVTAVQLLAVARPDGAAFASGGNLGALATGYGVPVLAFAIGWLAVAGALTLRAARADGGLPFSLAWWSFTFPIGTCVTGSSELALRTGAPALTWLAAALFALLVAGWLAAAGGTVRGLHARSLLAPA